MIARLILLMMGHALADFALQSDSMARGKNLHSPILNVPAGQKPQVCWQYWLAAHGLIHGLMVSLVTGNLLLGLLETLAHCAIDFGKCDNYYGIHEDQLMHFACKVLWSIL